MPQMDGMGEGCCISHGERTIQMHWLVLGNGENDRPITEHIHLDDSPNIMLGKSSNQRKSIPFHKQAPLNNIRKSRRMMNNKSPF